MRTEERRVDALLCAKQQDLQAINDRVRAEEDRAQHEFLQHQRDVIAFQAEADRLTHKHNDQMSRFQREERVASSQRSRFQRSYPPRRRRPSAPSPLGATPLGECCINLSALALSIGARDPRRRAILSVSTVPRFLSLLHPY